MEVREMLESLNNKEGAQCVLLHQSLRTSNNLKVILNPASSLNPGSLTSRELSKRAMSSLSLTSIVEF